MRTTRVAIGITLIAAGTVAAVLGARSVVGDQAHVEAAVLAAETLRAQEQNTEQARAERAVAAATHVDPLQAAVRARVDGPTLVDLFDNEDWWKPFRTDFPIVRIQDGDRLIAMRGADLGHAADAVIAGAHRQAFSSGIVKAGDQSYVVAAAALPGLSGGNIVVALARPFAPPAPAAAPAAQPSGDGKRPITWGAALALALCGLGLIFSGRRAVATAVPDEVPHEPTSRFGTPARPRAHAAASTEITAPGVNKARITDGNAVRIPGAQLTPPALLPAVAMTPPRPVPATAGDVFGRYRLIDRLGEGGMSELFVAEAAGVEGFTRNFVLKRLRPELARDKEAVAQFIDEARLQAGLVHSNIVPVFDFGVVNGEYFMTQEYIVGRDLARLVGRYADHHDTGLPETMAYFIAHETLQALAFAHERNDKSGAHMGIVHRDISAGNIMVSLLGEVKLGDFGIVKSNRRVSKTQVGMVKGNANFMSPEQARGQTVDHRSDLFSLGHVLYYCLTGCLLYTGENDLDVLYRAANGITAEDVAVLRRLPEPAGSILLRALAFEPEHRFQTAAEFADALAPHAGTGKTATAKLMAKLFGDDLRRQVTAAAAG